MSDKILEQGEDLLDQIISLNLLDENNFINLEEQTLPLLPNPQKSISNFRFFRNRLAQRPSQNPNLTAKLERVNSLVNEKVQDSKLIKIDNRTHKVREKADDIIRNLNNFEQSLEINIDNRSKEVNDKLNEILKVLNEINEKIDKIINFLDNLEDIRSIINDEIKKLLDYLKNNIEKPLLELKNKFIEFEKVFQTTKKEVGDILTDVRYIASALGIFIPPDTISVILERLLTGQDQILGGIGAILAVLTGEAIDPRKITPSLDNFKNKIKEAIKEWFKDTNQEIYNKSSEYICQRIVGESYIKYDGSNLYMPTLIFKFITENNEDKRKYSQLKLRLNYQTNEIKKTNKKNTVTNLNLIVTPASVPFEKPPAVQTKSTLNTILNNANLVKEAQIFIQTLINDFYETKNKTIIKTELPKLFFERTKNQSVF